MLLRLLLIKVKMNLKTKLKMNLKISPVVFLLCVIANLKLMITIINLFNLKKMQMI